MSERVYTVLFPFCGLGAGAMGFLRARAELFGREVRFASLGGIDIDPEGCVDFETLTGSRALCADIATMTVAQLHAFAGAAAPDVVFSSPPCKGFSGLLSEKRSQAEHYQKLNRLVLDWTRLMLAAWAEKPPRLVLIENVPRIETRGKKLLAEVKKLLRAAGYVFHASAHDCGELGGLAQHRRRFLLVARHAASTPTLLYQPRRQKVRGCGEVLGLLPLPGDPSAGPMHRLPKISYLNWLRLALIPPGGDWRDLPRDVEPQAGNARKHDAKYAVIRWADSALTVIGESRLGSGGPSVADVRVGAAYPHTYGVLPWDGPSHTVTGMAHSPGTGPFSIADPRIDAGGFNYANQLVLLGWDAPAHTITGGLRVGAGAQSVADPRLGPAPGATWHKGKHGVLDWDAPSRTVIGGPSNGADAVADPRFNNVFRLHAWEEPTSAVTSGSGPTSGNRSVADPRLRNFGGGPYGVQAWGSPAGTVTGNSWVTTGAFSIADPRVTCAMRAGAYGVLAWSQPAPTIGGACCIDNATAAVADPRVPGNPPLRVRFHPRDVRKAPPYIPVLPTADRTWHRPLTTLELAALQGLPTTIGGQPLVLAGSSATAWRERIGNAVPVPAAEMIARQMLLTLAGADAESFALAGGDTPVWVERAPEAISIELGGVQ